MDQAGRSYYEDYIVSSHINCDKSVVLLLSHDKNDAAKKVTFLETGIIVASGKTSCCIMTSHVVKRKGQVCEVQFFDGTKRRVKLINVQEQFGIAIICVENVSMANVEPVRFSDKEVDSYEKVFTCGYNLNLKERSFFSGSIVSGVGMKHKIMGNPTLFVHGCATGLNGHVGSAVFDERQCLVGMNVLYTRSSGEDYYYPIKGADGADQNKSDIGGIVYALDLPSINLGLASSAEAMELRGKNDMKGKTIPEIVQYVTELLLHFEAKREAAKDVGSSKGPAGGG